MADLIVGIDLGTTNSEVAVVEDGKPRVLTGDVTPEQEVELVARAKKTLAAQSGDLPALKRYLENWTDWQPWP